MRLNSKAFIIPFLLLNACDKQITVEPTDRTTLTFVADIKVDKQETNRKFQFTPSPKVKIKNNPVAIASHHQSAHLFADENYLYFFTPKGLERFSLKERRLIERITLPMINGPIWMAMKNDVLVMVNRVGLVRILNLSTKEIILESDLLTAINTKPVLDGNLVFIQSASNMVTCFDIKTKQKLWTYQNTPGPGIAEGSSPIVYKDYFITGFTTGDFSVINKHNGLLQWNDSLSGQLSVFNNDIIHTAAKPLIENNLIYAIGMGDNLSVYRIDTGDTIWSKRIGSSHDLLINNGYIYILDNKGVLMALNKTTGHVRMICDITDQLNAPQNFTNMLVVNDQLFTATLQKKRPLFDTVHPVCAFINPGTGAVERTIPFTGEAHDVGLFNQQLFLLTDTKLYVLSD